MLSTIDEVIEALGGAAKVAALCGVGLTAVSNWRSRGRIPPGKSMIFAEALKALGKTPSPSVFGFESAGA